MHETVTAVGRQPLIQYFSAEGRVQVEDSGSLFISDTHHPLPGSHLIGILKDNTIIIIIS